MTGRDREREREREKVYYAIVAVAYRNVKNYV